jgi:hypothetical protein
VKESGEWEFGRAAIRRCLAEVLDDPRQEQTQPREADVGMDPVGHPVIEPAGGGCRLQFPPALFHREEVFVPRATSSAVGVSSLVLVVTTNVLNLHLGRSTWTLAAISSLRGLSRPRTVPAGEGSGSLGAQRRTWPTHLSVRYP